MKNTKIALQLYTVRNHLGTELPETLQRVKEMGYDGIEYHTLDGRSPAEIVQLTSAAGLEIFSLFIGMNEILTADDNYLQSLYDAGFRHLTLGWLPNERIPGGALYEETCEAIKKFASRANQHGFRFLYHNHDSDMVAVDGTTKRALDIMLETLPEDLLGLEPDVCWLYSGGVEPTEYLRTYRDRSPLIHLKDCVKEGGRKEFRAVGRGVLNFPEILQECGHAKWLVIEQDEPSEGMDEFECAACSVKNLRSFLAEI